MTDHTQPPKQDQNYNSYFKKQDIMCLYEIRVDYHNNIIVSTFAHLVEGDRKEHLKLKGYLQLSE